MRRIYTFLLLCTLLFSFCACDSFSPSSATSSPITDEQELLSQIYEISGSYLPNVWINGMAGISKEPVEKIEELDNPEISIDFCGQVYDLIYTKTLFYPCGDYQVREYLIQGAESIFELGTPNVLIAEDGSVHAIRSHFFAHIDITETDSPDVIQAKLKEELQGVIDFSKYAHWTVSESPGIEGYPVMAYFFSFYNEYGGYNTDYVKMTVRTDGSVSGLWFIDPVKDTDTLDFTIDKDREQYVLDTKVNSMVTEGAELLDYHLVAEPFFNRYDGDLCVNYSLEISISTPDSERFSYFCNLLIPVRLLVE